ncbi:MAG: S-layer homology domain-containing protein [Peptococcaceae bacterium]|nr:S-layer homology domain-containing protein [Peptococcaceae bacterium]
MERGKRGLPLFVVLTMVMTLMLAFSLAANAADDEIIISDSDVFVLDQSEILLGEDADKEAEEENNEVMLISPQTEDEHIHSVCNGADCTDPNHASHGDITWTAWESDTTLPKESGNYYLTKDVHGTWNTTIASGVNIKLCLNGHSIDLSGKTDARGANVYIINPVADFTLCDCGETSGKITGAGNSIIMNYGTFHMYGGNLADTAAVGNDGAGVQTYDGTFNMYGGKITNNKSDRNGGGVTVTGAYNGVNGVFNMYGGEISGNTAKFGGGVNVTSNHTFNMYGGIICDNATLTDQVSNTGGGIYNNHGTINIYDGEISSNTAKDGGGISTNGDAKILGGSIVKNVASGNGGGVFLASNKKITLGGTVLVSSNTVNNAANNIYIQTGIPFEIVSDTPFAKGAEIGITYYYPAQITEKAPINVTAANEADYSAYFKSDDAKFVVINTDGNIIQLAKKAENRTEDSEVVVKDGTPAVSVEGLDVLAAETNPTAKDIKITMTVESKAADSANSEQTEIKNISSSEKLEYLDIGLIKTVDTVESSITETTKPLKIIISFDEKGKKNIKVYRFHNGAAEVLSDNAVDDEYYTVGDGAITVYAKKFSIYAIGYDAETSTSGTGSHRVGGGSTDSSYKVTFKTGENGRLTEGSASIYVDRNAKIKDSQIPSVTANEGYAFIGWSIDGKTVAEPTKENITATTIFTALYEAVTNQATHDAYIIGYDGAFRPDGKITRAEMAAMLARVTDGFSEKQSYPSSFADVPQGLWYGDYIGFAEQKNIIMGYEDGTFQPEGLITRAEFATMIARFAEIAKKEADTSFTDIREHWAAEQIQGCYEAGYMNGYPDHSFQPNQHMTRGEAVVVINRVLDRDDIKEFDNPFYDVNQSHWAYQAIMEAAVSHSSK